MASRILFITGTGTSVGKTVLACQLVRFLRARGVRLAALKPVCAGGRSDARALCEAAGKVLSLDDSNPWHFRAALAPVLAARREGKRVRLGDVVDYVRRLSEQFDILVIEGAGGLLSPLGEGFDSRDLILALQAIPVVVTPNRLGAVNQTRLALTALPKQAAQRARVVLANPGRLDAAAHTNPALLAEFFDRRRIQVMPYLGTNPLGPGTRGQATLRKMLGRLADGES